MLVSRLIVTTSIYLFMFCGVSFERRGSCSDVADSLQLSVGFPNFLANQKAGDNSTCNLSARDHFNYPAS